ncbi:MAG: nitrogenase-stabilizing/protective protein NifW [Methylococcaceae bacterium]|nr:nitrogenase-stabilizing/protective protein NifW [Methylococcaceae bacterium]
MSFEEEMEELESAEDFLQYFQLEYEPSVVHVNRLHILQRFHDESDAQTEKVFKVFSMGEPQTAFVSLGDIKT